jgi:uncharacterized protein (DUF2141 family)
LDSISFTATPFLRLKPVGRIDPPHVILAAMMRSVRIAAFLVFTIGTTVNAYPPLQTGPAIAGCIVRVEVDNLRNAKGVVGVLLFTSPEGWPEDSAKSFRGEAVSIPEGNRNRKATVEFDNIPPGDYGVVALHDENKNMKLDKNMFGWPKEGFGFANNPRVSLGAPDFRQALLHVACPATETEIHIIYK